jgi:hypothetical protein
MMALSVFIGAACGFTGIYVSYFVDVSSGASIVLVSAGCFVAAMLVSVVRNHLATMRGTQAHATAPIEPGVTKEVIYD